MWEGMEEMGAYLSKGLIIDPALWAVTRLTKEALAS